MWRGVGIDFLGGIPVNEQVSIKRQSLLDGLATDWSPREIRDLAASLLRLADAIDSDWSPPASSDGSIFRWPTALARIERNAVNLAWRARLLYEQRRRRTEHIPAPLLGEPAWDMLLDLFQQYAGGAKVSTTSLCIAADCPPSTALRHIDLLENSGLVARTPSTHDRRMVFVELTEKGIVSVGRYLEAVD